MNKWHFILLFLIGFSYSMVAQESDKYKVAIHGGIGVSAQLNHSFNDQPRFAPYSYGINGSLSMSVGGFTVPISLYFSQVGVNTNSNFNRIGLSPTYKNLKVHIGHRSMTFSPYVLNGNTFLGLGVEYNLGSLRLAVMKGRIQNLNVISDSRPILGLDFLRGYNRNVNAVKVGFGSDNRFFDLIVFKGSDEVVDIFRQENSPDVDYQYFPKDNFAVGFNTQFDIKNRVFFRSSVMSSAFSDNSQAEAISTEGYDFLTSVFQPNVTSQLGVAGQLDMKVRLGRSNIGGSYERVSPQFETLGRYYNLNDTERIRMTFSTAFRKVKISSSYGIERNDLASTNINSNTRNILSVNISAKVSKALRIRAKYSNFNVDNSPSIIEDNDTLKVSRVLTNASITPRYTFGKSIKHTVTLRGSVRQVDNKFAFKQEKESTYIYRGRLTYSVGIKELDLKASLIGGYQFYQLTNLDRENITIGTKIAKVLLDHSMTASLSSQYTINNVIGKSNGYSIVNTFSLQYSPIKQHAVALQATHFIRNRNVGSQLSELRSRISYNYSF